MSVVHRVPVRSGSTPKSASASTPRASFSPYRPRCRRIACPGSPGEGPVTVDGPLRVVVVLTRWSLADRAGGGLELADLLVVERDELRGLGGGVDVLDVEV